MTQPTNSTNVHTRSIYVADQPTAYLNPGKTTPFAVVDLGDLQFFVHEAGHAQAIADAFSKAAQLLNDAAAESSAS